MRGKYKCGKTKLQVYLKRDHNIELSESTIDRWITSLPIRKDPLYQSRLKLRRSKRKRKNVLRIKDVTLTGQYFERFQIDTKYWISFGRTYYVVTAVDTVTRMAVARAYTTHTSNAARDFLKRLIYAFDIKTGNIFVQRDNGSEFMGYFEQEAKTIGATLITNHPRTPEENGFVERFNRTLKDEMIRYNSPGSIEEANDMVNDFIVHYDFNRVHASINYITPFERYAELSFKEKLNSIQPALLQRLWTSTMYYVLKT